MIRGNDKEDLSICYIATVAANAGISYDTKRHDADSTDGFISHFIVRDDGRKYNAELRVQLKCTSSTSQYTDNGDSIIYTLKVKNYNDLCAPATSRIILGLLILPENENDWIKWTSEDLMIKGCMYWLCLAGQKESNNSGSVNVKINKSNIINSESIHMLLEKVAREDDL